ncbi:MAG: hypothetical protein IKP86_09040 [Anaerolineaceae bacterium]|nr:hypothetical protein [Anaerolineaceae bacterium]
MKKTLIVLTVILCLFLLQSAAWADADEKAAEYLNTYFGISFEGEVTLEGYNNALKAIGAEPLSGESFTLADAVVGAVRLAGMEELALTYTNEKAGTKASEKLAEKNISADDVYVPYIACALDLGLVSDEEDFNGAVTPETAAALLYRSAELCGKARHYIGHLSDDLILSYARVNFDSVFIFDDEILNETGINILISEAATGYSLFYSGYEARFLENYTIRYGHDTPTHLLQLIALLQREGFDGYLQIEPKVSVYEYLPEWGEPQARTATYSVVEMMEGRYFAFAVEYEIAVEFNTTAEKEAFHDLVDTYAKKYDDRVDEEGNQMTGLLHQSFWQPLYYSRTEMENEEYTALTETIVLNEDGSFEIRSIGLPEQSSAVAIAAASIDPTLKTGEVTVYVNPAFYRYITDSDYQ